MFQQQSERERCMRLYDRKSVSIDAHLEHESDDVIRRVSVRVVEFSPTGAWLESPEGAPFGEVCRLWIGPGGLKLSNTSVVVRRNVQRESGTWDLGVEFTLAPDVLTLCSGEHHSYTRNHGASATRHSEGTITAESLRVESVRGLTAYVSGELVITQSAADCELDVEGRYNSPEATIIGGRLVVLKRAELAQIGSKDSVPTEIVFGTSIRLSRMLDGLRTGLEEISGQVRALEREKSVIEDNEVAPHGDRERLMEIPFDYGNLKEKEDEIRATLSQLESLHDKRSEYELIVHGTIHPGVVLRAGTASLGIETARPGPVRVTLIDDAISLGPLDAAGEAVEDDQGGDGASEAA